MNQFLSQMMGKITQSDKYLWLAKAHVVSFSMAMGLLVVLGLGVSFAAVILGVHSGTLWLTIARLVLLYALELIVVGSAAIALRAALTKELALMSGRSAHPKFVIGRQALLAAGLLGALVLSLQLAILYYLPFFF